MPDKHCPFIARLSQVVTSRGWKGLGHCCMILKMATPIAATETSDEQMFSKTQGQTCLTRQGCQKPVPGLHTPFGLQPAGHCEFSYAWIALQLAIYHSWVYSLISTSPESICIDTLASMLNIGERKLCSKAVLAAPFPEFLVGPHGLPCNLLTCRYPRSL